MKHLLTIAGSDCGGGAGIQADLKTFSALGTYGLSVITAITAQNTRAVTAVVNLEPSIIEAQIDAVFDDIRIDAVKIGMLGTPEATRAVARRLREWKPPIVVLDPVMVSKSDHRLLDHEAEHVLIGELLPLATIVTPNLPEAAVLIGAPVDSMEEMRLAARTLHARGAQAVLVKGGHLFSGSSGGDSADDLLFDGRDFFEFSGRRLAARHTHGTGCSLSSAVAAFLARGQSLCDAVGSAKAWVARGIAEGLPVGKGVGPIHHFHEFWTTEGVQR